MGWVSGAPANIPGWVPGQAHVPGDAVVYAGAVYATTTPAGQAAGSAESNTPPDQPIYGQYPWFKVASF